MESTHPLQSHSKPPTTSSSKATAGKTYTAETIAEFERQGVEAEWIGALALLEQAVLGQFLTEEILTDIRRRIARGAAGDGAAFR